MESDSQLDEYLQRIEVPRPTGKLDIDYLTQLQIGHLTHVPFETFDLIDLKLLDISRKHVFERIVRQHRGGVCYQMNGIFESALKKLGFDVRMIPCAVYNVETDTFTEPYAHLSLFVRLETGEEYLCDAGFSRDFLTPLFFRTDCIQYATNGFFRLSRTSDGLYYLLERGFLSRDDSYPIPFSTSPRTFVVDIDPDRIRWTGSYRFSVDFLEKPTQIEDFQGACPYIVHSPNVILNHCSICRIATAKNNIGTFGIVGKNYYEWKVENGVERRQSFPISSADELKALMKEKFGLKIDRTIELVGGSE